MFGHLKKKFFVLYLTHLDVVDFKKEKKAKERAKNSQEATEKNYKDYAWKDLCENLSARAKQIRPHKVITRHWLLQMSPEGTDLLQTRLRETEMKLKMNLC